MGSWQTIVVGVDGSPSSRKALAWAAAEAADHGANLTVINVWEHTLLPPAGSVSVSEHYVPDPSQRTAEDLLQVIKEELGEDPPVLVQPQVKQGRPAKVLIEESAGADLLVVGERGHGGFAGLVLGSVSQHVAAYAKCPVTVVH
ncbi:universal stress protein [Actinoplanes sp. NPDC051633]|uniref:universal stress protein n=1 Tax=Actinoplanes sp. NPDC051633 TaxID=3155670 RepID=UPI0034335EDA